MDVRRLKGERAAAHAGSQACRHEHSDEQPQDRRTACGDRVNRVRGRARVAERAGDDEGRDPGDYGREVRLVERVDPVELAQIVASPRASQVTQHFASDIVR